MQVIATDIPDLKIIEPRCFGDERGFFFESYSQQRYAELAGIGQDFVQDNHSRSVVGVLRGLHYQLGRPQGKLVRVVSGEIFDVGVDLRRGSPTFGKWAGVALSATNRRQLWLPAGFAHGFYVLSECAEVLYKATDYYSPGDEHCLLWNDPAVGIAWPFAGAVPLLSDKDRCGRPLADLPLFP
ncbi:MAG: dTDP-4-dehydrorhamnose 3,5-epimerase [Acidobacteria bacterium]|nr:dTDP-4-dehydrorhamnose 3,5-epimerase [Acidobacteriota bacterium]